MTSMKNKTITFAAKLQELLDKRGMTGYRLAQLCGLPKQTVHRYLNNREPTFLGALRIAKALGISLSEFDCVTVMMDPTSKE